MALDDLPEELLLRIFSQLDSEPPSVLKVRNEPSLDLIASPVRPLKQISLVCRQWRRIVLPLLFKHSCLQASAAVPLGSRTPYPWITRLLHAHREFSDFLRASGLAVCVQSLAVAIDRSTPVAPKDLSRDPPTQLPPAELFWGQVFDSIDPRRLVIVAGSVQLGQLVGMMAMTATMDHDAFSAQFQSLELWRVDCPLSPPASNDRSATSQGRDCSHGSILCLRHWHRIGLNEGSFVQGYATLEHFELGRPALMRSILPLLGSFVKRKAAASPCNAAISFAYTAVCPFAHHANFVPLLEHIETLDLKIAPDPQSGILDDVASAGRVDLHDCWHEVRTAYVQLARATGTLSMSRRKYPNLKAVICQDFKIPQLHDELDDVFACLCLPVWAEFEPGVFKRLAMSPTREQTEYRQQIW